MILDIMVEVISRVTQCHAVHYANVYACVLYTVMDVILLLGSEVVYGWLPVRDVTCAQLRSLTVFHNCLEIQRDHCF